MARTRRRWTLAAALAVVAAVSMPALASAQAPAVARSSAVTPKTPDFSGTVALDNCSGSIIRWSTSQPTDDALMLTNGHCYDFLGAKQVIVDQPAVRDVDLLNSDGSVAATVQTTTLVYATMWRTDVSLYQLPETYQQLQDQYGVPAITVSDHKPSPKDQPIAVISGYWRTEYDCNLNGFAYRLHEYVWTWNLSLRYSDGGCQVIGGTSGSPVLDSNRTMIGINNTINEDGERCTLDNPCEENRRSHISVHENRGYGQETWLFYTCLTDNQIDLSKDGCRLPSP
jgi:V8-like Glu-specific endopeptidase